MMKKMIMVLESLVFFVYAYYSNYMQRYAQLTVRLENQKTPELLKQYLQMDQYQWYIHVMLMVIFITTIVLILFYHFKISRQFKDIVYMTCLFMIITTVFYTKLNIFQYVNIDEINVLKQCIVFLFIPVLIFIGEYGYRKVKRYQLRS